MYLYNAHTWILFWLRADLPKSGFTSDFLVDIRYSVIVTTSFCMPSRNVDLDCSLPTCLDLLSILGDRHHLFPGRCCYSYCWCCPVNQSTECRFWATVAVVVATTARIRRKCSSSRRKGCSSTRRTRRSPSSRRKRKSSFLEEEEEHRPRLEEEDLLLPQEEDVF